MATKKKHMQGIKPWTPPEAVDKIAQIEREQHRKLTKQETMAIESEERRQVFLKQYFKYGGNIAAACAVCGIVRRTVMDWRLAFPEFAASMDEHLDAQLDLAEAQLIKNIEDGKEASLFFFLCNKGKSRNWQHINKIVNNQFNKIEVNVTYAGQNPQGQLNSKSETLGIPAEFEKEK